MLPRVAVGVALFFGYLAPLAAFAVGWQPLGPDGGSLDGFAQAPSDPDIMYCLPQGLGVHRSTDRGESWHRVDTGLPFAVPLQRVAVSPTNASLLVVGDPAAYALRRSTDGGETWLTVPIRGNWSSLEAIAFDPIDPKRVLAAIGGGVYPGIHRSTDDGLTWQPSNAGIVSPSVRAIAFHPTQTGVVLAGNDNGVYRSTDGGASWSPATGPSSSVTSISFCAGSPNRVWVSTFWPSNLVARSDDGGLSFAAAAGTLPADPDHSIAAVAAHPSNPNIVVGAYLQTSCVSDCVYRLNGTVRSTDGGVTWLPITPTAAGAHSFLETRISVAFDFAEAAKIYLTSTTSLGGLLRSEDGGLSWQARMHGIAGRSIGAIGRDGAGTIYVPGTWRAAGVGAPWELVQGAYSQTLDVNRSAAGLLLGAGAECSWDTCTPFYSRSTDGGTNWTSGAIPAGFSGWSWGAVSNHGSGTTFYAWVNDTYVSPEGFGTLLSRSDDGVSFAETHFLPFNIGVAVMHPTDTMRVLALSYDTGAVRLTTDGGATWTLRATGLPTALAREIFMDPVNPDRLAVVYYFAGAYRSDDGGLTWNQFPLGISPPHVVAADWDPVADRFALATWSNGVFLTGRGFLNTGLPTFHLNCILFVPESGHLLVGTSGASVQTFDLSDPSDSPVVSAAPRELDLLVSPNPSDGRVRFEATVPVGSLAVLEIYTVAGRRVVTLASEVQGVAQFTWDGRDASRVRVAPGVYFVRVTAGSESRSCRVVRLDR